MKYIVENRVNGSFKPAASFSKRSAAVEYAELHGADSVQVRRKTDFTNRIVFSRSISQNNGFVTVSTTETIRASK